MVSCFKRTVTLSLLALAVSCGQDGNAPSLLASSGNCTPTATKRIFATSVAADGGRGGVNGVDAFCMADANYPGTGTFKAFVVNGSTRVACTTANCSGGASEHVDWVLQPCTDYTRVDGTPIGTTADEIGIFATSLTNAFSGVEIWTGMHDYVTDQTCSGFNSSLTMGYTSLGNSLVPWEADVSRSCNQLVRFACVEQ